MLVSHRYKFIFVKTHKTAGTSLEVDFSKLMGNEDVVTPIIPAENGHLARNHDGYFNHMAGKAISKKLGRSTYRSYFKFCVEREPVSKCISFYSMQKNSDHHQDKSESWTDFVARRDFPIDANKYTDFLGKLIVDRVLRYENLNAELSQLMAELGVPFVGLSSRAKSGMREEIHPSEEECAVIYEAFKKSNKHTGYLLEDRLTADRKIALG